MAINHKHGTSTAARYHYKDGGKPCESCRAHEMERVRKWRANRRPMSERIEHIRQFHGDNPYLAYDTKTRMQRCSQLYNQAVAKSEKYIDPKTLPGAHCECCGSIENLHTDHIIPLSRGGEDTEVNVQALCMPCNISKGDGTHCELDECGKRLVGNWWEGQLAHNVHPPERRRIYPIWR